jgi:hypothetical protein
MPIRMPAEGETLVSYVNTVCETDVYETKDQEQKRADDQTRAVDQAHALDLLQLVPTDPIDQECEAHGDASGDQKEKVSMPNDAQWVVDDSKTIGIILSSVRLDQLHIMKAIEHGGSRARLITRGAVYKNIKEKGWVPQAGCLKITERWTDWEALKRNGTLKESDNPRQWFNDPDNPIFGPGALADVESDPYFMYRSFWVADGNHRVDACHVLVANGEVSDQRGLDPCIRHNVYLNVCVFVQLIMEMIKGGCILLTVHWDDAPALLQIQVHSQCI